MATITTLSVGNACVGMSTPSTSNRGCNAPAPTVVGHLVANAGCRARVLPARMTRRLHQRQRTVPRAVTQEEVASCSVCACAKCLDLNVKVHSSWQTRYSSNCSGNDRASSCVAQEEVDLDQSVDVVKRKLIDAAGAGKSFTSPGWLTQLGRLWGGKSVCFLCLS